MGDDHDHHASGSGFLNALLMLAVVSAITVGAIGRLRSRVPVAGEAVTVVAVIGLLVNPGVAWVLSRGERNLNARGAHQPFHASAQAGDQDGALAEPGCREARCGRPCCL